MAWEIPVGKESEDGDVYVWEWSEGWIEERVGWQDGRWCMELWELRRSWLRGVSERCWGER
jgi:hypothetical protein